MGKNSIPFYGNLNDYWYQFNKKGIFKFFKIVRLLTSLAALALFISVTYYLFIYEEVFSEGLFADAVDLEFDTAEYYCYLIKSLSLSFIILWLIALLCASFGKFYKRIMGAGSIRNAKYGKTKISMSSAWSRRKSKNALFAAYYGTHTVQMIINIVLDTLFKIIFIGIAVLLYLTFNRHAYYFVNIYLADVSIKSHDFLFLLAVEYTPVIIAAVCWCILKIIISIIMYAKCKHWKGNNIKLS